MPDEQRFNEKAPILRQLPVPIPTYEEATSSRAPSDYGDDGESTTLLPQQRSSSHATSSRPGGYRPPTVESERSSIDSSFLEEFASARSSEESLQREMIQMELMEGEEEERRGSGLRQSLSKRLSSISWISLPRNPFRGWRFPKIPEMACCANLNHQALMPVYRLLVVLVGLIILWAIVASDALNFKTGIVGSEFDPSSVREFAQKNIDKDRIAHWMEYLSSFDHVAGTEGDFVLANYVERQLETFGLETEMAEYNVYLNYPKKGGRRVWMENPRWEAKIEEVVLDKHHENTLVWHAHSKAGDAKGPLIYANYGSPEDFAHLESQGIKVKGAIVLMRYGGTQSNPGLKVKAAELAGAVGCLLFTDPKTEGWAWPGDAVRRASVSLVNWFAGDALTPEIPSGIGSEKIAKEQSKALVKIPSLPLSWNDARGLLHSLKGKGKKGDDSWTGGVPDVAEYWTGSVDDSPEVNLKNDQVEEARKAIWNVMGQIRGTDAHEMKIVIGNHRDAWCFGASDPNSGTAIMLEVARVFGEMMKFGWHPLRTIQFMNWDGSEYNLIGSTEYVEDGGENLRNSAMAYINIDTAVTGKEFAAAGSPGLKSAIAEVLHQVRDPLINHTMMVEWAKKDMPGLGTGGDYVAFQHHAGISSVDLSFTGDGYPQNSCYDNYNFAKNKDPNFSHHTALAKVLALLVINLADTGIAPFNMNDYLESLKKHTTDLAQWVHKKTEESSGKGRLDIEPLALSIVAAEKHITTFSNIKEGWMETGKDGLYTAMEEWDIVMRRARSTRMSNFDKHLLDLEKGGGLPGREWYKHMVMSPQAWSGGDPAYFPSIRDAIEENDWELAQKELQKVATLIERASRKLLDESS
ncbi:hypothetical protein EDC01DRAFT_165035 [Geopyxis carbonaria]|nr:hypothetical protein EDC01DRAFT_165035 [Geopyxis carbonaria]